ncbi:MAG: hypothetical protein J6S91_02790, partial [Treponema sp.]|nr:hypothetical protein [Treponema sp.]
DALIQSAKKIPEIEEKSSCLIATGMNATPEMTEEVEAAVQELLPDIEISVVPGGQEVYTFMIGF